MNSRQRSVLIRITIAIAVFLYVAYAAHKFVLDGRLPKFDFGVITAFVAVYFIWTILSETLLYQDPDIFVIDDEDQWSYAYLQLFSMVSLLYAAIDFLSVHWTRMYILEPGIIYAGFSLFLISCFIRWRGFAAIGKYFNPRIAVYEEHVLITGGIYRAVRHPLYLGVFISQVAFAVILSSWGALLITWLATLPALIHRINLEETFMVKHFGDQYREYMRNTRKLIPGLW